MLVAERLPDARNKTCQAGCQNIQPAECQIESANLRQNMCFVEGQVEMQGYVPRHIIENVSDRMLERMRKDMRNRTRDRMPEYMQRRRYQNIDLQVAR